MKSLNYQNQMNRFLVTVFLAILLYSCGSSTENAVPKPKGYNYIDLPKPAYSQLPSNIETFPYTFEYSNQAVAFDDTSSWKSLKEYYKIIDYKEFQARLHITYKPINNSIDSLNEYITESYRLLEGHNKKAYDFRHSLDTLAGNNICLFEIEGEVPSPFQFYAHDSTNHFMRGAVYFDTATKNDSLAPVIDFVKNDVRHLLETLEWQ